MRGGGDVIAEAPDVVIIATGGLPHTEVLESGNELVVSAWDIISGEAKPGSNVLIFDDAGDHAALQAAEVIAEAGGKVEIMTPDRSFAPEVMAMNLVPYMRSLQKRDVTFTVTFRLEVRRRDGNQMLARIGSDYGGSRPASGAWTRSSSTTAPCRSTSCISNSSRPRAISARSTMPT